MPAKLVTSQKYDATGAATVGASRRNTIRLAASARSERARRSRRSAGRRHTTWMARTAGISAASARMPPHSASISVRSTARRCYRKSSGWTKAPGGARAAPCYPRPGFPMPDLGQLIASWGYVAIFAVVILGNLGLPVPEESVLTISGYLCWQGHLHFAPVAVVAIVSAVLGDNMAYWLGRRYGQRLVDRLATAAPARIERMRGFVVRYGMLAVFVARFVAGLRFMAGPLAGRTGLDPLRFFAANLLGAVIYVPMILLLGYGVGYGLGDRIEALRRAAGSAERIVVIILALLVIGVWAVRAYRSRPRA